jgi:hypothetical protein
MLCVFACTTTGAPESIPTEGETGSSSKPLPRNPGRSAEGVVLGIAAPSATGSKDESNEIICRKEPILGSNFRKKRCRSAAEIEAEEENTQFLLRDFILRSQ